MPVSSIHGLASSVTVRNGAPPRRARRDKSDFLTLIQSMKDGEWFLAPEGTAGNVLRKNIAPWRANGRANAHVYRADGGRFVVIKGYLPEPSPPTYPQIQNGPPPLRRTSTRSPKNAPFVELLKNMKPGEWAYATIKPMSVYSIISRFKRDNDIRFKTFYSHSGKLVVIRDPEAKP